MIPYKEERTYLITARGELILPKYSPNLHYLYLIKNCINKRCYIGVTENPRSRFIRHVTGERTNKLLYLDFQNIGYENFEFDIVCFGSKAEMLELEESVVIPFEDYNETYGGGKTPSIYW
jgi:hypothetical protein